MQCNIDARGRRLRRNGGILCVILAAACALAALRGIAPVWTWTLAAALLVAGLFQLFESWKGWCAIRAMGFKTPV